MKIAARIGTSFTVFICGTALSAWGVRYEVNTGNGWVASTTIDTSAGAVPLDFRISVFHDGGLIVPPPNSNVSFNPPQTPSLAVAPLRLCNSQRITNFGAPGSGDSILSFRATVSHSNPKAVVNSNAGSDTILGTPNSVYSFASNLSYGFQPLGTPVLETQFYSGRLLIGTGTSRIITITANSFAYPNAADGNGGTNGGSFYTDPARAIWGPAAEPALAIPAVITVESSCPCDFNGDREIGDPDFELFVTSHDLGACDDPEMPAGCPADLNGDGSVDDLDFAIFAVAYDALICP